MTEYNYIPMVINDCEDGQSDKDWTHYQNWQMKLALPIHGVIVKILNMDRRELLGMGKSCRWYDEYS